MSDGEEKKKKKKKEDIFYTLLKEFVAVIGDAAEEYADIIHGYPNTLDRVSKMKEYETACDECVQKIMSNLYTAFITPFDREDISQLALAMDDVVDSMNDMTCRLDLFNIQDMREEAVQMADLTLKAVKEMQTMIEHLPNYKKDKQVMKSAMAIGELEDEGDTVYQGALRRLFHDADDLPGRYAVTWLRIFDHTEECIDACESVAVIVRDVVMKSA